MKTKRMKGMGDAPMSKLEVLDKYPKIAEALQQYASEKQMGSGRMMGSGWWDDFVGWLKSNKVISGASKLGATIATAFGAVPLAAALSAVSAGSSVLGYGYVNTLSKIGTKRMKGKGPVSQNVSGALTGKKIMGRGPIYAQNGMLVKQPTQSGGGMRGYMMGGETTKFNVVSTQPSKVAF